MKAILHDDELIGICEEAFIDSDKFEVALDKYLKSIGWQPIDRFKTQAIGTEHPTLIYGLWDKTELKITIAPLKINHLACEFGMYQDKKL